MNPSGRVKVTTVSKSVARLHLYGYGEDDRVPNEGDILIVSDTYLADGEKKADNEFELLIRGKDMWMLAEKVSAALTMYEANKEYLSQPVTRVTNIPRYRSAQFLDDLRDRA